MYFEEMEELKIIVVGTYYIGSSITILLSQYPEVLVRMLS